MVTGLTIALFGTVAFWLALSYVVGVETVRRERVMLVVFRSYLDRVLLRLFERGTLVIRYVDRRIIRLSWYYSLHSLLQAALRVVVSLYDYLEKIFHINRKRARAIRAERRIRKESSGMLQSVALHKETTALTPTQKKKLRTKKLERE